MKKFVKCILFFVVFCGLNSVMSFLFVPAEGASRKMWEHYQKMESLDMVYVGSSVCQSTFNPVIIDEIMGTNSYNMGTPSQPIDLSYVAAETAIKEHQIKRVVLGFGYFALTTLNSQQAEAAFIQAKNQQGTFAEAVFLCADYIYQNMGKSISINFFFPWVNNHVKLNLGLIVENVNKKTIDCASADNSNSVNEYESRGMLPYTDVINYNEIGNNNSWDWYQPEFSVDAVGKMRELCELCQKEGVELIVVNTPRPTFDIATYEGDYYAQYLWLKKFFDGYGVAYYDFNFAKPEIFVSQPAYYYNFEHLNVIGADAFSKSFAKFLLEKEQGRVVEDLFYNWEEYLDTIENYEGKEA